jgi:predicted RNA binding protein YcfA (HicA-like mRNA interferase family)
VSGDLRKLLKAAEDQGFTVRRTRKGHWQVRNAEGSIVAVIAATLRSLRQQQGKEPPS